MNTPEIISTAISFFALSISAYTAYKTILARFKAEVLLKPRAALTNYDGKPCIVVGFDISNLGARTGAIDDFVLLVKYKQQSPKGINSLTFLPILIRDDYSVFKTYDRIDFDPFQSISVPKESKITKYVVFTPTDGNFLPSAGSIELQVYFRESGSSKFKKTDQSLNFSIESEIAEIWESQTGKSILLESKENDQLRENLMNDLFQS